MHGEAMDVARRGCIAACLPSCGRALAVPSCHESIAVPADGVGVAVEKPVDGAAEGLVDAPWDPALVGRQKPAHSTRTGERERWLGGWPGWLAVWLLGGEPPCL